MPKVYSLNVSAIKHYREEEVGLKISDYTFKKYVIKKYVICEHFIHSIQSLFPYYKKHM